MPLCTPSGYATTFCNLVVTLFCTLLTLFNTFEVSFILWASEIDSNLKSNRQIKLITFDKILDTQCSLAN